LTGHYRTCIDGKWYLVRRLPNAYLSDYERGAFGMVKHIGKPLYNHEGQRPKRLYHDLKIDRLRLRKVGDRVVITLVGDDDATHALAAELRASGYFVTVVTEQAATRQAAAKAEQAAMKSVKRDGEGAVGWYQTGRADFWGASECCRLVNRGGVPERASEMSVA
jgi:hypothetical protein